MKPFIHSNGNSRESLASELTEARRAVKEAINKIESITVNMRNYYPLENGQEQFEKDREEKIGWLKKLDEINEGLYKSLSWVKFGK